MKKLTASLAALVIAACGTQQTDPAQQYRDALPKAQAVAIGTPQDAGTTSGALSVTQQPLGQTTSPQSEFATMSYYLALSVNGGVAWVLATVRYVTAFPPTSCDDASCTWGPWVDDQGLNRWKLTVTKNGTAFDWALSAQPGSNPAAAFVDLITGTAYPADKDHGHGTLAVNFDAQTQLDHGPLWQQEDFGTLAVTYDNRTSATVDAVFLGAHDKDPANPHRMNAHYLFQAASSGGQLEVAFQNLDTTAVVTLRTRWSPSGAGRADAHYTGPDGLGGTASYYESECWAGKVDNFVEVYDLQYAIGTESACSPFSTAEYTLDIQLP